MGVRVREFNGDSVVGTVNVSNVRMMGEFFGEWMECSLLDNPPCSYSDRINFTISYYGVEEGNNTLDTDGISFITIELADNTTWWNDYGYEIELTINSTTGDSEVTGMWFDLWERRGPEEGGEE